MSARKKNKKTFFNKLHNKYRLVLMDDATFEERISFRLTRFNVFLFAGTLVIFLVFATTYLIAFTPLREYIPGYADFNTRMVLRELVLKTDSLERDLRQKDLYIRNIRNIVEGRDFEEFEPDSLLDQDVLMLEELPRSRADSILRSEFESYGSYGVHAFEEHGGIHGVPQHLFFPPVQGIVTNFFDPSRRHFGIDVVADQNTAIKSVLDGTVLFSSWTLETGYTIGIQHGNNLVSIYKHNSVLLKDEGSFVRAGEAIAIIGETGLYSTGTHLHFELWFNGNPLNPLDFIVF